jgi:phosphomannomutase
VAVGATAASGPALVAALMRGLVAAGVEVIDIGAVTTPCCTLPPARCARSGIQVTGSHNPKDYNGFKMVLAGRAIYGEEIQALRRTMEAADCAAPAGGSVRRPTVPAYASASWAT